MCVCVFFVPSSTECAADTGATVPNRRPSEPDVSRPIARTTDNAFLVRVVSTRWAEAGTVRMRIGIQTVSCRALRDRNNRLGFYLRWRTSGVEASRLFLGSAVDTPVLVRLIDHHRSAIAWSALGALRACALSRTREPMIYRWDTPLEGEREIKESNFAFQCPSRTARRICRRLLHGVRWWRTVELAVTIPSFPRPKLRW